MVDEVEAALGARLRVIAAKVKEWEDRDLQELIASGSNRLFRPAYFADLESVAAMLEGRHVEHKLRREKPNNGRPASVGNVDRDLAIARLVDEYRRDPKRKVKDGIAAACDKFNVSDKVVEAADRRMRSALIPGNEVIVPYLHKLAARGLVKVNCRKTLKK